ncbi:MAG: hypothetical protein ACKVP4_12880 [Hyphomicrobium sp.]
MPKVRTAIAAALTVAALAPFAFAPVAEARAKRNAAQWLLACYAECDKRCRKGTTCNRKCEVRCNGRWSKLLDAGVID